MYPMLENLKKIKKTEITFSGTDNISQPALFLSNHRDILTDSAFLQYVLVKNGLRTSEIAIGNNLMVKPWIAAAMRINKSFVVRRNITKGEQLSAFLELSGYIAYAITCKNESIWLAHREGRAKDSDDRTQINVFDEECYALEKSLVQSELRRVRDFALLSENLNDTIRELNNVLNKYVISIFK